MQQSMQVLYDIMHYTKLVCIKIKKNTHTQIQRVAITPYSIDFIQSATLANLTQV